MNDDDEAVTGVTAGIQDGQGDDALRELMALAAVGALSEHERSELDRALASRPDLVAEFAGLQDTAATLAHAAAEVPPAALRAGVLATIRGVSQETAPMMSATPSEVAVDEAGAPSSPATHSGPLPSAAPTGDVVSITSGRRRRWLTGAAAVAAVAAAAVGVLVIAPFDDGEDDLQVSQVVESENAVVIELSGELSGLQVVHSPEHRAMALVGDDVPPPDGDMVYELWLIDGPTPTPLHIFRPDGEGDVEMLTPEMMPPPGAAFAVTVEPPGGSDQPTGDVVASSV